MKIFEIRCSVIENYILNCNKEHKNQAIQNNGIRVIICKIKFLKRCFGTPIHLLRNKHRKGSNGREISAIASFKEKGILHGLLCAKSVNFSRLLAEDSYEK